MPELPEVEATREDLEAWLRGKTIVSARIVDRLLVGGRDRRIPQAGRSTSFCPRCQRDGSGACPGISFGRRITRSSSASPAGRSR